MDLYSTNYLTGVVNSLQTPPSFLLDHFFPTTQTETSEEIHFDVENDVMGLAPFVSPVVEGQILASQGFTTNTFKPAYIKPKSVVDPTRALKRYKGEPIAGAYSPQQRLQLIVADLLMTHRKLVARRLEWMAASVLCTGAVTITGERYQTRNVNFNRLASHNVTLASDAKWSNASANPLDDLQSWTDLILQDSGTSGLDVVLELSAWKAFRNNQYVAKRIEMQRGIGQAPSLSQDALNRIGGTFMGNVDGYNIWAYSGSYKDDQGVLKPMLPIGTVLVVGDMSGVQAFGAILDEAAGIQALPYFSKSWVQEDPSRRFLLTQSAPLLVPYRPNAAVAATVL
jgi:hypothetical protein